VNPLPDPLLLRKSGSAGNRTWTSGSVTRNSDYYTTEAAYKSKDKHNNLTERNLSPFSKRFKFKTLRKLANAPWYILNITLHNDLCIPYVTEVIRTYAKNHKNLNKQNKNQLIRDRFNQPEIRRRLNRMWPEDLICVSSHMFL
jgi:hypothetical protein